MKKNVNSINPIIRLFFITAFILFCPGISQANVSSRQLKYAPNEVILKLKAVAHENMSITIDADKNVVTGLTSLDDLHKKYGLSDMRQILAPPKGKVTGGLMQVFPHKPKGLSAKTEQLCRGLQQLYLLRLKPDVNVEEAIAEYQKNPYVEYAEPNYIYSIDSTFPNDSYFNELWGLHNTGQTGGTSDADIDAPEAWDIANGSRKIVVAVIDTGVDYRHEDLTANMWTNPGEIPNNGIDDDNNGYVDDVYGIDAYNSDSDPMDDHYHGTHCAGTVGAVGNNKIGVTGVNWYVSIMALKFLSSYGSGYTSDAVTCVNYAINMGANIMSNSWGGGGYSQALKDAIEAANSAGMLFIAAAGNSYRNNDSYPQYPSSYDNENIIAVAATDHNDNLAYFSNYGPVSVDVAAPGVSVYSCKPGNSYQYLSGTSMATPHVAGLAALLWSISGDNVAPLYIKSNILTSVDKLSGLQGKLVSEGRINAYQALIKVTMPHINSLSPNNGLVGQKVTIAGTKFGNAGGSVTFYNGKTAAISAWSNTQIECAVPDGAVSGNVIVTTADGISNGKPFTVCPSLNTFYRDADSDVYGDPANTIHACLPPAGYVADNTDCDDDDAAINPKTVWYKDSDGDGYSDGNIKVQCIQPVGYYLSADLISPNGDCDDGDKNTYPGAFENITDNKDNNCNGVIDECSIGWQHLLEDTRLTSSSYDSNSPSLGIDGSGNIHIAWCDYRNGKVEIYYTKLDNSGNTVVDDTRLTSNHYSHSPSLGIDSSGNIHIAWSDSRNDNSEIYYTKLDNSGNTVVDDTRLTIDYYDSYGPSLGIDSSGNIHIAWYGYRNGNSEIYYTKLDNSGNTVVDDTVLTSSPHDNYGPSLGVDGSGNIHIAWYGLRNDSPYYGIYYTKLDNSGNTVVDDTVLTSSPHNNYGPSLGVDGSGNIHIAWHDNRKIYYTKLDNSGNTVVDDTSLTNNYYSLYDTSLGVDGSGNIHIAWHDSREIYYTLLDNFGKIVLDDTRLTPNQSGNATPQLAVDSSMNVHIVWSSDHRGNYEIYYTQGSPYEKQHNYYRDADGDSYGNPANATHGCSLPAGYVSNPADCNDSNAAVHPGVNEVCDNIDNNCNGMVDEGVTTTYYHDLDGDGYGNPQDSLQACSLPANYVTDYTDCDDGDPKTYPGAEEDLSGSKDRNCNGFLGECSIGWQYLLPDTRLTSDMSFNQHPSMGMDSDGNFHVVWHAYQDGYSGIYYTKLDSSGRKLVSDTRLTANNSSSYNPDLTVDKADNLHIVWEDYRDDNPEIYYTKLDNSGNTLTEDTRLTADVAYSYDSHLVADNAGNLHVVWEDYRDGNPEIYYTKLDNSGNTLTEDTRLTSNSAYSYDPSLGIDSSGNLHILWIDSRDGNPEIYYTKLDNSGNTLIEDTRLTFNRVYSYDPSLGIDSSNNLHIAWGDRRDGNAEIYYTKLDSGGNKLVADTRLTFEGTPSNYPYLKVDASGGVHIVWSDYRDGNAEIYYSRLSNVGKVLLADVRLSSNEAPSQYPCMEVDAFDEIHVVWADQRDGNPEIYYTKGIPYERPSVYYRDVDGDGYGNPNNSIKNCTHILPSGYVTNHSDDDDDADGLPDDWEYKYFGHLSYGPNHNPDGDDFSNYAEFLNGTNPAHAPQTYYVDFSNDSGNEDGSLAQPFNTIAKALAVGKAQADDTVRVAAGTYQITEDLVIPEGVKLIGERWYVCSIALGSEYQIQLDAFSTLTGFKITSNGGNRSRHMFFAQDASSVTISNNVIKGNLNYDEVRAPAAIFIDNSSGRIENNTIDAGHTGIHTRAADVTIINNIVINNLYALSDTGSSTLSVDYNDFWNNTNNSGGANNISQDPLFIDIAADNYHLQNNSFCRNAGNPNAIYNDKDGSLNDIGADGGPSGVRDATAPAISTMAAPMSGADPLEVSFTGIAGDEWGIASWAWDFDILTDPQTDSIVQNPSHIYAACGGYIVKLTVTDHSGNSASGTIESINVDNRTTVDASADTIAGKAPLLVNFSGSAFGTSGSYTWCWDFDARDGIQCNSTEQNPKHTYDTPGAYNITLAVGDDYGCKTPIVIHITVVPNSCTTHKSQMVSANTAAFLKISDSTCEIDGVGVSIPAGALSHDSVITISEVTNPPAFPSGMKGIGVPVDFGPDETAFSALVTITIPYTDADLTLARVTDPHDLKVYYYDTNTVAWTEIMVTGVDTVNKLVFVQTTHFTIYTLAAGAPNPPSNLNAVAVSAGQIDLSWTDNSTNEEFFSIERSSDGGTTHTEINKVGAGITTYSDTGLKANTYYCYRVLALKGNEYSGYSNENCAATKGGSQATKGGGKCFIATAAYGTSMSRQVRILSRFRDEYLLVNPLGKRFVAFYYKYSPPIAEYIAQREFLRILVRIMLWPLIGFSLFMLKLGLAEKLGVMIILFLTSWYLSSMARKYR